MSRFDVLNIGCAPTAEPCVQVNPKCPYLVEMLAECNRYKQLLMKLFPIPEELSPFVYFSVDKFSHDFGTYAGVCIHYDSNNEAAFNFALDVEANCPKNWEE
jgi:hypothetical protein